MLVPSAEDEKDQCDRPPYDAHHTNDPYYPPQCLGHRLPFTVAIVLRQFRIDIIWLISVFELLFRLAKRIWLVT